MERKYWYYILLVLGFVLFFILGYCDTFNRPNYEDEIGKHEYGDADLDSIKHAIIQGKYDLSGLEKLHWFIFYHREFYEIEEFAYHIYIPYKYDLNNDSIVSGYYKDFFVNQKDYFNDLDSKSIIYHYSTKYLTNLDDECVDSLMRDSLMVVNSPLYKQLKGNSK
ncbi:MAG: hypothetical protein SPL78_00990 [Bacteroidales bacterium]|nr:hypothetical protein [Bacteroidales bacterium]